MTPTNLAAIEMALGENFRNSPESLTFELIESLPDPIIKQSLMYGHFCKFTREQTLIMTIVQLAISKASILDTAIRLSATIKERP